VTFSSPMGPAFDALIRAAKPAEARWIEAYLTRSWGSTIMITRGVAHDASNLPALVAVQSDEIVGLATFRVAEGECELVSLDVLRHGQGIGSALLARVSEEAANRGCRRLWLITTNDNLDAIRFYQRRGLRLVAVHPGAVDAARRIKRAFRRSGSMASRSTTNSSSS